MNATDTLTPITVEEFMELLSVVSGALLRIQQVLKDLQGLDDKMCYVFCFSKKESTGLLTRMIRSFEVWDDLYWFRDDNDNILIDSGSHWFVYLCSR
jgi:hypothetical protein